MLKVKFLSYFKFMQIVAQTFFISKKELRTIIELNVPGLLCPIFSFNPIHSPNNHTHHHNHHRNYHRRIPQPTLLRNRLDHHNLIHHMGQMDNMMVYS